MILDETMLVAVVIGLVQVAKQFGLATKWAPLLAVVIGIVAKGVVSGFASPMILEGVVLGLTAAGLWSGVKTTLS